MFDMFAKMGGHGHHILRYLVGAVILIVIVCVVVWLARRGKED
jgi:ABC-type transporter Mla subunit MlaD